MFHANVQPSEASLWLQQWRHAATERIEAKMNILVRAQHPCALRLPLVMCTTLPRMSRFWILWHSWHTWYRLSLVSRLSKIPVQFVIYNNHCYLHSERLCIYLMTSSLQNRVRTFVALFPWMIGLWWNDLVDNDSHNYMTIRLHERLKLNFDKPCYSRPASISIKQESKTCQRCRKLGLASLIAKKSWFVSWKRYDFIPSHEECMLSGPSALFPQR